MSKSRNDSVAIVTGSAGQIGSILCELLLEEGYGTVVGVNRRSSRSNDNLAKCTAQPSRYKDVTMDITDVSGIRSVIEEWKPDFWFNMAAMTQVGLSFKEPLNTFMVNSYAVAGILELLRHMRPECRYYNSSSSEIFGRSMDSKIDITTEGESVITHYQNEETEFLPRSPYAVSKLDSHHTTRVYREAYGMFACAGILFNSESPRRHQDFVTRKITYNIARIKHGLQDKIRLGNLEAYRDINWAYDSARAILMMMEADEPDDYVIATGQTVQIKAILEYVCNLAHLNMEDVYEVDEAQMRPADVAYLRGDSSKLRDRLGWRPTKTWSAIIRDMYEHDMSFVAKEMASELTSL